MKNMLFLRRVSAFCGARRNVNENGVLSDLLYPVPGDADVVPSGKTEKSALTGNENGSYPPVAKVYLVVYYVPELSGIANIYNYFARKSVCVASHQVSLRNNEIYILYSRVIKNITERKISNEIRGYGF